MGVHLIDAARDLEIDQGALSRIERGLRYPSKQTLRKLMHRFGLSAEQILFGDEDRAA